MSSVCTGFGAEAIGEGSPRLFRGERRIDGREHVRFLVFRLAPSKPEGRRSAYGPVADLVFAAPDQELDGAEESRNSAVLLIADMLGHGFGYRDARPFAFHDSER